VSRLLRWFRRESNADALLLDLARSGWHTTLTGAGGCEAGKNLYNRVRKPRPGDLVVETTLPRSRLGMAGLGYLRTEHFEGEGVEIVTLRGKHVTFNNCIFVAVVTAKLEKELSDKWWTETRARQGREREGLMNAKELRAEHRRNPFRAVIEVWDGKKYRPMFAAFYPSPMMALSRLAVGMDKREPADILKTAREIDLECGEPAPVRKVITVESLIDFDHIVQ
jgi:hypothetical protein